MSRARVSGHAARAVLETKAPMVHALRGWGEGGQGMEPEAENRREGAALAGGRGRIQPKQWASIPQAPVGVAKVREHRS